MMEANNMKIVYILAFSLLFSTVVHAQETVELDKNISLHLNIWEKQPFYAKDFSLNPDVSTTSVNISANDTLPDNRDEHLLNDDPEYNQKYPWWRPALKVVGNDILTWTF